MQKTFIFELKHKFYLLGIKKAEFYSVLRADAFCPYCKTIINKHFTLAKKNANFLINFTTSRVFTTN